MKRQCIILDDYQNAALAYADWSMLADCVDIVVIDRYLADREALVAALAGAAIVIAMRERTPFPADLFARLPDLRLLVTSGMRNAAIDLAAAKAHGVTVCGTGSASEPPVELTWALILGLARHLAAENAALRANGPWQGSVGADLAGRTLGLVGLGKIGAKVAAVGAAFGMRVLAWSPNLTRERAAAAGVEFAASKRELFAASDIVSIHLVLGATTRGLIGAADFAAMRRDAFFVNTSRAAIVDERALVEALEQGRIAGAGLDVFETEPLPPDHAFRRLPNVLATPHLGYVTARNYRTYFGEAAEDIAAWLAATPVRVLA